MRSLSVCMPCWYDYPIIKYAVKSVIDVADEVVIFDSGNDGAQNYFENLNHDKIKYTHSDTFHNWSDARNQTLKMASGDIIGFLDADIIINNQNLLDNVKRKMRRKEYWTIGTFRIGADPNHGNKHQGAFCQNDHNHRFIFKDRVKKCRLLRRHNAHNDYVVRDVHRKKININALHCIQLKTHERLLARSIMRGCLINKKNIIEMVKEMSIAKKIKTLSKHFVNNVPLKNIKKAPNIPEFCNGLLDNFELLYENYKIIGRKQNIDGEEEIIKFKQRTLL